MSRQRQREVKIYEEIERIINCVHKNVTPQLKDSFYHFAEEVLGEDRVGVDGKMAVETMKQKIADTHGHLDAQLFEQILNNFCKNQTPSWKQPLLISLFRLSQLNSQVQQFSYKFPPPQRQMTISSQLEVNTSNNLIAFPLKHIDNPRRREPEEEEIKEYELVKQLSFIFTNSNSDHIIQTNNGYELKTNIKSSLATRQMINEIAQLGWLHNKIQSFSNRPGAIRKSLNQAILQQLKQFYIWNNAMQPLIKSNHLSLRQLYIRSAYPLSILKWLAMVLEEVESFDGGEMISIVNLYRPNGCLPVNALINRLLSHILKPFLNFLHCWMYMGELRDQYEEFFIEKNKYVTNGQWQGRFRLIINKIPNILDEQSAEIIFNNGKSMYYLRNICKINFQIYIPFIDSQNIEDIISNSSSLVSQRFMIWLKEVGKEVDSRLSHVLFDEFNLRHHLQSMNMFFLGGKGDFIQYLYFKLEDCLERRMEEISEHSLSMFMQVVAQKCFKDERNYQQLLLRLKPRKINFGRGHTGMDCFNLHYSLQHLQPLQPLLSTIAISTYQKIFHLLWQIKRKKQILKRVWRQQSRGLGRVHQGRNEKFYQLFHLSYMLRNQMLHFIANLQSFILVGVEARWSRFISGVDCNINFNQLLKKHAYFQEELLDITLLSKRYQAIRLGINGVFQEINNFSIVYNGLNEHFKEYTSDNWKFIEDKSMNLTLSSINEDSLFDLEHCRKDLRGIQYFFGKALRELMTLVQLEQKRDNLDTLLATLNFSAYYPPPSLH